VAQQSRGLRDLLLIDAWKPMRNTPPSVQRSKAIRGLLEQLGGVLHQPQALVLFKAQDARGVYSPLRELLIAAVKAGDKNRCDRPVAAKSARRKRRTWRRWTS
jgi:methyl-accepting chemotaxis protein